VVLGLTERGKVLLRNKDRLPAWGDENIIEMDVMIIGKRVNAFDVTELHVQKGWNGKCYIHFFFFWWDWGLNSGFCFLQSSCSTTCAMPPVHFSLFIFRDEDSQTIWPGWPQTWILLNSASQASRIIGMHHQHPACYIYFTTIKSKGSMWSALCFFLIF
jgi:hypothetical protein